MVGYSLGGGIGAAFASYFPHLLSSLTLLAPSGLLRDSQISRSTRILYAKDWFPESIISSLVKGRLKSGPLVKPKKKPKDETVGVNDALTEELAASSQQVLSRKYPDLTSAASVRWQVDNHPGFVHAFISSIRHGPIPKSAELENWKRLGNYLSQRKHDSNGTSLPHDKVLVVLGENDNIIFKDHTVEDVTAALEGNAQFAFYTIGHEFPSVKYDDLANQLIKFWK